jgi:hypothetical protein
MAAQTMAIAGRWTRADVFTAIDAEKPRGGPTCA